MYKCVICKVPLIASDNIHYCEKCSVKSKNYEPEACPHDDFYVMNTGTATCRTCKYWWQDAETVKVAADRGFVRLTNDYIEDILNLVKSDSEYTECETNDLISVFRSGLERTIPPLWGEYVKRYEKHKDPK